MSHPLRTTTEDLVEGLKRFEEHLITKEAVRAFLEATQLSPEALRQYTFFKDDFYTRNLIYRDRLFEVIAALKEILATHAQDPAWRTVRPPLSPLSREQAAETLAALGQRQFAMPSLAG